MTALPEPTAASTPAVIDSCAFHEWASDAALRRHMEQGWRDLFDSVADSYHGHGKGPGIRVSPLYRNPFGDVDPAAAASGPAGSDPALLRTQLGLGTGCDRVVLSYDEGLLATAYPDPYLARTAARAANELTAAEWLDPAGGVFGLVLVGSALPEDAAEDIRRFGREPGFVGVAIGANSLGVGFGHPVYRPIFRAAAEMGLPVVLQANSDSAATLLTPPMAGGLAATYAEYKVHIAQAASSHISGMILSGVFAELPDLRVLMVGCGVTWIPATLWRHDYFYKIEAHEAPWLEASPSEYFQRHVRVATYPIEAAEPPARVADALAAAPWLESILMYASGYPAYDWQRPGEVLASLPEAWHERVLRGNALEFYRWPDRAAAGGRRTQEAQR